MPAFAALPMPPRARWHCRARVCLGFRPGATGVAGAATLAYPPTGCVSCHPVGPAGQGRQQQIAAAKAFVAAWEARGRTDPQPSKQQLEDAGHQARAGESWLMVWGSGWAMLPVSSREGRVGEGGRVHRGAGLHVRSIPNPAAAAACGRCGGQGQGVGGWRSAGCAVPCWLLAPPAIE